MGTSDSLDPACLRRASVIDPNTGYPYGEEGDYDAGYTRIGYDKDAGSTSSFMSERRLRVTNQLWRFDLPGEEDAWTVGRPDVSDRPESAQNAEDDVINRVNDGNITIAVHLEFEKASSMVHSHLLGESMELPSCADTPDWVNGYTAVTGYMYGCATYTSEWCNVAKYGSVQQ